MRVFLFLLHSRFKSSYHNFVFLWQPSFYVPVAIPFGFIEFRALKFTKSLRIWCLTVASVCGFCALIQIGGTFFLWTAQFYLRFALTSVEWNATKLFTTLQYINNQFKLYFTFLLLLPTQKKISANKNQKMPRCCPFQLDALCLLVCDSQRETTTQRKINSK